MTRVLIASSPPKVVKAIKAVKVIYQSMHQLYTYYISVVHISMYSLREVGLPSRNILHGRGVGSKSRIRVTRVVGSLGAFDPQNTYRNCSLDPLFLGPRMRDVYRNFVFRGSTS